MTVLLASLTTEGIVFASDSRETFLQSGQLIARDGVQKIFPLGSNILFGTSGEVGMQQRVRDALEDKFRGQRGIFSRPVADLKMSMRDIIFPIIKDTAEHTIAVPGLPAPQLHTIFCGKTNDKYWIFEVDPRGNVEEHTERGFCAAGSGGFVGQFTVHCLAHLSVARMQLYKAQLVAFRIINDIIRAGIFGVGGKVQITLLDSSGVRQLSQTKLDDLEVNVSLWKEIENSSLGELSTGTTPPSPT
jgi:20S proteasome alpha/beta subunit